MEEFVSIAKRLREVRRACRIFLDHWMVERINAYPAGLDRLAHDLSQIGSVGHWGRRHFLDD